MRNCKKHILLLGLIVGALALADAKPSEKAKPLQVARSKASKSTVTNKLLYLYRLYYLPFSVYFQVGADPNEIIPFVDKDPKGLSRRLINPTELEALNDEWDKIRQTWKRRSLFLTHHLDKNESKTIASNLVTHRISMSRRAFDGISLTDRIKMNEMLKLKSKAIQKRFKQLRFLRSFVPKENKRTFQLFVVSASWCESCMEYRALLESYAKKFPSKEFTLHSVVIEDPKSQIFDSQLLKELFPHPEKYSHESIPRFLALDTQNGQPVVHEEGDALKQFYNKFLAKHQGFLNSKTTVFRNVAPRGSRKVSSKP